MVTQDLLLLRSRVKLMGVGRILQDVHLSVRFVVKRYGKIKSIKVALGNTKLMKETKVGVGFIETVNMVALCYIGLLSPLALA